MRPNEELHSRCSEVVTVTWRQLRGSRAYSSRGTLELDLEALSTQVTSRDYGTMLGQALFRDRIREAFLQARTQSEDNLSVQLFVEAAELRTLRWERLCAPVDEQWRFLLFPVQLTGAFLPSAERICVL